MTDLSGFTPNIEAIAAEKPDLVVISNDEQDLTGQLGALGIDVWLGPSALDFDDIYEQIEQLGARTGHIADAAAVVAQMQTDIETAVSETPELSQPPSYFHELDPTYYTVTSDTFIGGIYGLFGLQNIADTAEAGNQYPQLSAEFIIGQNPDLIFLADSKCCDQTFETVADRAGWNVIAAVQTENVYAIDDDIISRWGPRVVEAVQEVAGAVKAVARLSAG